MKVVIINCFDTYEERVDLIHEFFKDNHNDVTIIQSDFRHFKKMIREDSKENTIFIKTKPYYRNLSITRLYSHYRFAKDSFKLVESLNPDVLYTFIPPNSLAKFAAKYKKRRNETKLIFDVIDLWPETMPIGNTKKLPPFTLWGALRDNSFKFADFVITECDLYQTVLENSLKGVQTETLYLAKKNIDVASSPVFSNEIIHLAYLGSINNIIDISRIKDIIYSIKKYKKVTLHIIGDGESKDELIEAAKLGGAEVRWYGKIYDSKVKQDIFDSCHFGLNIMKKSVCVGLTMKSIDYFQHGLPILNNIQADTTELVDKYDIGYNVTDDNINDIAKEVSFINEQNLLIKRNNVKLINKKFFSSESLNEKLQLIMKKVLS